MPLLRDIKDQLGSSYLRDHAENPVAWRTWSDDALDEAQELQRPIFLSIGYAACHWCHVMAHESFEDEAVAQLLNENFIPIKVDREERPDVDALYMAATQLVSGHGGWPMSVFLLPDGRPFMAGTYYPPVDRHGQVSFTRLLNAMSDAWANRREAVEEEATKLRAALAREVTFVDHLAPFTERLDLAASRRHLRDELLERLDRDGGFGGAPKFPRPSFVEALLEFDDEASREAVSRTLDAMSRRGLYDHLRGGFARYSVDEIWHVPHFEKMLSDQALLAIAYFRASRSNNVPNEWRAVAIDTINFVLNDLSVENGFACSLDTDAGSIEGSHVTWTPDEVRAALCRDGLEGQLERVLHRWRITSPGEFEGRSIPRLANDEPFVAPADLDDAVESLRRARANRVQPLRDEKVILEWNAMFASALFESNVDAFIERGESLLAQLWRTHFHDGVWWRTQSLRAHASASDVAWLLDATVTAFERTGSDTYIDQSRVLASYLLAHYWDGSVPTLASPNAGKGIFAVSDLVTDLSARPKEIFDGATPSSHAVTCRALARLALCSGDNEPLIVAERLAELGGTLITSSPIASPDLVLAAGFALEGVEIVVPGPADPLVNHLRSTFVPRAVLITGSGVSPLLRDRIVGSAYVCRGGVCRLPVSTIADLDAELDRAFT